MENQESDDCEYCREVAGNEDLAHCQYCHDAEVAEDEAHCQYCVEADAAGDHEHTGDDCEYCREAEAEEHSHPEGEDCEYCREAAPEDAVADDSQDYAGADLNPPAIDKPTGEEPAPGLGAGTDDMVSPSNAVLDTPDEGADALPPDDESIYNADEHSKDAMQNIVAELDDSIPGESEADAMNQIDADQVPVGDNMEGNVSRPESYGENTPADMGMAEDEVPQDEPDLSGVLQEGLDSHADNIQRERVVDMVSQALEGFKASKNVLESAKEQAPQLYQSSIAMLKAMIEMAKMLGLGQDVEEQSPGAQEEIQQSPEGRPDSREPAHFGQPTEEEAAPAEGGESRAPGKPAHFGKPAEGEAPGKKPVGQSANQ